ncbi:hypothetical protein PHISCL_01710 [Aspergillus sclerotialis]|uniref:Uncharacterized protein n=1 Tax=Aspergillus sclerotialis TaxID=2070753 RepID=A0A3A3A9B0_9EURO|nr:hypothetical protein PHISCL_01710 [Aspergillus sclerotialis]
MSSPVSCDMHTRPTAVTPSTFSQDISRAILASNQAPKSAYVNTNPHAAMTYPPTPPPSPVGSKNPPSFWGGGRS